VTQADRLGPYRLDEALRHRGLYVTYAATHQDLARKAWVVTTAPSLTVRDDLVKRLETQAVLIARFGGEATLSLFEVVRDGGRCGIVLEAPSGPSLTDLSKALSGIGGLTAEEAVAVGVLVSRAVARIHAGGAAHLALSPDEIFFGRSGAIRLGGLLDAAPTGEPIEEKDIPEPGPEAAYRAPERIAGETPRAQSDVFSIGVIVHELAGHAHPFAAEGGDSAIARQIRTAPPPPMPADAIDGLEHVLGRALEKIPSMRHESAARLGEDLTDLLDPAGAPEQLARAALARGGFDVDDAPPTPGTAPRIRPLVLQLGAIGAAMIVVAATLGGAGGPPAPIGVTAGARVGHVRVLAHPWAEVSIDGEVIDTTPIGKPIAVAPGRHEVLLRHPRAPDERREIDVIAGQTVVIDVEMAVERKAVVPIDPSP
jgi:eukaryotic-like serine/threonine-protein kinase